jgi:hypothetical protein
MTTFEKGIQMIHDDDGEFLSALETNVQAGYAARRQLYISSKSALDACAASGSWAQAVYQDLLQDLRRQVGSEHEFRNVPRTVEQWKRRADAYLQMPMF